MTVGEYTGHALSAVALVVGGMYAKSAVLNWIVGPFVVVFLVALGGRIESRYRARTRRE